MSVRKAWWVFSWLAILSLLLSSLPPTRVAARSPGGALLPAAEARGPGSPGRAGGLPARPPAADTRGLAGLAAGMVTSSAAPVAALAGSATITLTATGFVPAIVTVTQGTLVTWYNATAQTHSLRSGQPYQVFVPLAVKDSAAVAKRGAAEVAAATTALAANASFSGTLPAGGSFVHVFATTGQHPYFLATAPHQTGLLVVVPPGIPPEPSAVASPIDPSVATDIATATSFIYSGPNPIQTGVLSGTIQPTRVAVLRGKVLSRDGPPLGGVAVTILNHPEYGLTLSRADGLFDLAVNGGGLLTVSYAREGYLPVQRPVPAPRRDYAVLPDVVMIPRDARVTTVDLAANVPMQVAQASVVVDEDGARQATLLFPAGTAAEITMPGGLTRTLTTLSVRATEYTVGATGPQAMPGELPPNSGYTYAVELSADEAVAQGVKVNGKDVRFSQPVPYYVENFLGFPAGITVPVGYYDNDRGVWVAAENGRVVAMLGVSGGLAELDVDGSNAPAGPAALAALGITEAERAQLASLYQPGQSLWRLPLAHFSTWDANLGFFPSAVAEAPRFPGDDSGTPNDYRDYKCASIIDCQNQTLGEDVDVVGTPFSLHYASDRAVGRTANNTLAVPVSGVTLPIGLKRIELEILLAGRTFTQTFPAVPNQSYTFRWDGKDAYGRGLQGQQPATVRLGYAYDGVYAYTSRFGYNGNGILTGNRTRREVTLWQVRNVAIGTFDARGLGLGLGGWSLSVHHVYDPLGRVLLLGSGEQRSGRNMNNVIGTVAGGGNPLDDLGDGLPATQAELNMHSGQGSVAVGADGSLYIADYAHNRVRWVSPGGIITTVAGTGFPAFGGDGGPATQAQLNNPTDVALGPDGSIYVADRSNRRVRRVGPGGIMTTVAGNGLDGGSAGFSGEGGPATQAAIANPIAIAAARDGSVYIANAVFAADRVLRVGPDGIISTVAGGGNPADGLGDGGPATQAALRGVRKMAVGGDGSLYVVNTAHLVRRVGTDGIIRTVAGNGSQGSGGDGGPATQAQLDSPAGIAVGPDGAFYVSEWNGGRVRLVGTDGIISTIAGGGDCSGVGDTCGDGNPATQAKLGGPVALAVGPDGSLFISQDRSRIRRVSQTLPGFTALDITIPSADGREVYQFDRFGRHRRTLNGLTGAPRYQFTYDGAGRLTQITDGDGNETVIQRDGAGKPTAIVGPDGQRTTLALEANGLLASITDPANGRYQFAYTGGGLLTTLTNPRGNVSTFSYDALGRLVKDQDPAGGFIALSRVDGANVYTVTLSTALTRTSTYQVESLNTGARRMVNTDPSGLQSTLLAGTDGSTLASFADGTVATLREVGDPRWGMQAPLANRLTVSTPGGLSTTLTLSRSVQLADPLVPLSLISQTDTTAINGRIYNKVYTASSRTITDTSPGGRQVVTSLDGQGRPTLVQIGKLQPVSYTYDSRGRLASLSAGSGGSARTTALSYGSDGFLQSITDPLGQVTTYAYDAAGRVISKTLPDNATIGYAYDANGKLVSLTPPGRPAHTFSYDARDRATSYTPPSGGGGTTATQYVYDADGELTQQTLPGGSTIKYAYDGGGRLQTLTLARGQIGYTYDPATGNVTSLAAPGGITTTLTYDGELPTGEILRGPVSGTITLGYDSDFRLASESVDGNPIAYSYDNDGLLVGAGGETLARDSSTGLPIGTTLGSIAQTTSYNDFGEPVSVAALYNGAALLSDQYTYDRLGRLSQKTETLLGGTDVFGYAYDSAGRLTQVKRNGATTATYTYDANGNRLSYTGAGGTVNGVYDAQDRLASYGSATYTYTTDGRLATKVDGSGTATYQYDELGSLLGVSLPNGTTVSYLVDATGQRIAKAVGATTAAQYLYAGGRLVAQLDGSGGLVSRFVYGSSANTPDYLLQGSATYRIVADHLGSPRLVVNVNTGAVAQRMDYDEFGNVLQDTNPGFQPFGFAGGLYDRDTGLVRFGARDYDSATGRWTAKDPIRFEGGGTNLYAYVSADPINGRDPSGLQWPGFLTPEYSPQAFGATYVVTHIDELVRAAWADYIRTHTALDEFRKKNPRCLTPKATAKEKQELERLAKAAEASYKRLNQLFIEYQLSRQLLFWRGYTPPAEQVFYEKYNIDVKLGWGR